MCEDDEYTTNYEPKLTPAQKGVHRRRMGIVLLIFALVYGSYAIIFDKTMNEIFISTVLAIGGGLLGIGKITKDIGE